MPIVVIRQSIARRNSWIFFIFTTENKKKKIVQVIIITFYCYSVLCRSCVPHYPLMQSEINDCWIKFKLIALAPYKSKVARDIK